MSAPLSIVMPVYNEAPVIKKVVAGLITAIADRIDGAEIVIVDDCSTDGTYEILRRLADADPRLCVERNERNSGHGPTMRRAIELSTGERIFHIDSDGQFVPEDFWRLWSRRDHADLVLGVRAVRHDPRHRLLLTRLVRLAVRMISGKPMGDPNVPFKLFRRALWDDARAFIAPDALAPSIMLAIVAAVRGWTMAEVEVTHLARPHGVSTLRLLRLARFSARGLSQIVALRARLGRAAMRDEQIVVDLTGAVVLEDQPVVDLTGATESADR